MSTSRTHLTQMEYERIDARIRRLDLSAMGARQSVLAGGDDDLLPRLQTVYRAVRPILAIVAELPLLPPHWREALRLFLATLDGIAIAGGLDVDLDGAPAPEPKPDFKAGKDL